jgi:hypothetical protein
VRLVLRQQGTAGPVWPVATDSWFFGANTPGKARRINIYPGGARRHREICEAVARAGYPGLAMY